MAGVKRARYVGPHKHLKGKLADIQPSVNDKPPEPGKVVAQFDSLSAELGKAKLFRGWSKFAETDFELLPPNQQLDDD